MHFRGGGILFDGVASTFTCLLLVSVVSCMQFTRHAIKAHLEAWARWTTMDHRDCEARQVWERTSRRRLSVFHDLANTTSSTAPALSTTTLQRCALYVDSVFLKWNQTILNKLDLRKSYKHAVSNKHCTVNTARHRKRQRKTQERSELNWKRDAQKEI